MHIDTIPWTRISKELVAFVYRRVKDKSLAQDMVQDVYLKIHSNMGQLKDRDKMMSWIYQITRNVIADHFRAASKKLIPVSDLEDQKHPLNDCVETCLGEMLFELPDKYRQALELTEMQNLSQTQLAEQLSISYSGAKSRVQRARTILKGRMEERYNIKTDSYGNIVVCENKTPCSFPVPFNEMKSS
ncbi:MAG: sigma-70 family RNA polymerase sigma factor [Cyclobacteriaceae bacterium]|nr:sigma-70 family RNA polymerase sigma factor [Cyclobacteriaceae bacterium]